MKHLLLVGAAGALLASTSALAGAPFGGEELELSRDTANYGPLSIYGDFRYSVAVNHVDADNDDDTTVDTEDNNSRIGFGGAIGVLTDTSVFYNISFSNESDTGGSDAVRDLYAGLRGRWGELYAGKRRTVFQEVTRWIDPFYDTSTSLTAEGSTYGTLFGGTDGIQDDQIGYRSGRFGPFSFNVALFSDDTTSEDDTGFELGLKFGGNIGADGHWGVSLNGLFNDDAPTVTGLPVDTNAYKVGGGVDFGMFGIGLQLEVADIDGVDFSDSPKFALLGATVDISSVGHIGASISAQEDSGSDGVEANVGFFAGLAPNVDVHAIVSVTDLDDADLTFVTLSVGTSIHFDVGMI